MLAALGLMVLWRITRTQPASMPQQALNDAALVQIERMLEHTPDAHDDAATPSKTDPVRSQRT